MPKHLPQSEKPEAQASDQHVRRQYRRGIIAMLATAAFAGVIVGLVVLLGFVAGQKSGSNADVKIDDQVVVNDPFYVLLIGSDTRKGTALYTGKENEEGQTVQYADVMTLMRVDPQSYEITLVTIPRDTVIEGEDDKINAALLSNNPQDVVDAVERLTGIAADYYAMVTFATFEQFIDAIGGIDVDVPRTVKVTDPMTAEKVTVKAGENRHLNGAQALVLSRARKDYATDQDALRQVNVRNVERAIIDKVLNMGSELDLKEVVDAFKDASTTNLDPTFVGSMVLDFIMHKNLVTIYDATGPYDGAERESDGWWVVEDDPEAWGRIVALTKAGFDPSGVVAAPTFDESDPQEDTSAKKGSAS